MTMAWKYTADIPDGFDAELCRIARVVLDCDPMDLARPLFNESGLSFKAHNPKGDASGIFQAMPFVLRGLGFTGAGGYTEVPGAYARARMASDDATMKALDRALAAAFRTLDAGSQLDPWMAKYYAPHRGKLVNATAVYMATFCPAYLDKAGEPEWVICGSRPSDPRKNWYPVNIGLDPKRGDPPTRKGWIEVRDLTAAIQRADQGPRWDELAVRITMADSLYWGPRKTYPDPALDPRNALVGAAAPSLVGPQPGEGEEPDPAA
jgi:hypothetical protein